MRDRPGTEAPPPQPLRDDTDTAPPAERTARSGAETEAAPKRHPDRRLRSVTAVWFVPVILIALYPPLALYSISRVHVFKPHALGLILIVTTGTALLTVLLLVRFTDRGLRWALGVAAAILFSLFAWNIVRGITVPIADILPMEFVGDVLPVAIAVFLIFAATRLAHGWPYIVVVTLVSVAATGPLLADRVLAWWVEPAGPSTFLAEPGPSPDNPPDILILILDGYGRQDVLARDYDFDNAPFLDSLEDRGFEVPSRAVANYSSTYGAVGGMLALDYPLQPGPITEQERAAVRALLSGDNPLFEIAHDRGYDVYYSENAWPGATCSGYVDVCIRSGWAGATLYRLSRVTIAAPLVKSTWLDPFVGISLGHMEELNELFSTPSDQPRLVFMHLTVPHPPFRLDADCNIRNDPRLEGFNVGIPEMTEEIRSLRIGAYAEQIECVNRLTIELVDTVMRLRPSPAVMITGDHGPDARAQLTTPLDQWQSDALRERMGVFSAYRLPSDCDPIAEQVTPIVGLRELISCTLNIEMAPLPNRSFLATPEHLMYRVIDEGLTIEVAAP